MPLWGLGTGRALRRYRRSVDAYRRQLEPWQHDADALREHVDVACKFAGATAADEPSVPLQLKRGERVFSVLETVSLVEPRRLPDRWVAGFSGFSFRLARGVRYHVGASKGRKVPGEETPSVVDGGAATVTDGRVVFQGSKRSREWSFNTLLGYHHDGRIPLTLFQVSNREKVSGLLYPRAQAEEFHFRLALALAHHRGEVDSFIAHLEGQLATHEASRPSPPELPAAARSALPGRRPG
ncbi:MAG: hypothetical protein JWP02_3028 [Acidimicrobiales bacterium]|nr:hypothetical protein [Acidimicrobiales bacterium]